MLVRLRVGMPTREIARNFGLSEAHFSRIFTTWINFLDKALAAATRIPSRTEVQQHLPSLFKGFEDTRFVVDCTEVRIQKPSGLHAYVFLVRTL